MKITMIAKESVNNDEDLRDYQRSAVKRVMNADVNGSKCTLVELPTGTGKTYVFGALARHYVVNGRVLFVAHRDHIVRQTIETAEDMTDINAGIVMGKENDYDREIVLCTIQTAGRKGRRDELIGHSGISLVVIDEVHHYEEDNNYGKLVKAISDAYPDVMITGLTATPYRNDKTIIPNHFQPVFSRSIQRMQADKWLAPIVWERHSIEKMTLAKVQGKTKDGDRDYNLIALSAEVGKHLGTIASHSSELIGNRQTVVFACNKEHMHRLADLYRDNGFNVGCISDEIVGDERQDIVDKWKSKEIQIVVNVTVLTEGFDYPGITAVIVARPTMSPGLYVQMIGRGLRTIEGKDNCLIVDYTGRIPMSEQGFKASANEQVTLQDILGVRKPGKSEYTVYENEKRLRTYKGWIEYPFAYDDVMDSYVLSWDGTTYTLVNDKDTGLCYPFKIVDRKVVGVMKGTTQRHAAYLISKAIESRGWSPYAISIDANWRHMPPKDDKKQLNRLNRNSASEYEMAIKEGWNRGKIADRITILETRIVVKKYLTMETAKQEKIERDRTQRAELIRKGIIKNVSI